MDITSLEWEADSKGSPKISVWAKCHTVEDVEDIIAWLHLAKDMMKKWERICSKRKTPEPASGSGARPLREADTAERAASEPRISNLVPDRNSASGFKVG